MHVKHMKKLAPVETDIKLQNTGLAAFLRHLARKRRGPIHITMEQGTRDPSVGPSICLLELKMAVNTARELIQYTVPFYFCNNFVKTSSILIIFAAHILQLICNKMISKSSIFLE